MSTITFKFNTNFSPASSTSAFADYNSFDDNVFLIDNQIKLSISGIPECSGAEFYTVTNLKSNITLEEYKYNNQTHLYNLINVDFDIKISQLEISLTKSGTFLKPNTAYLLKVSSIPFHIANKGIYIFSQVIKQVFITDKVNEVIYESSFRNYSNDVFGQILNLKNLLDVDYIFNPQIKDSLNFNLIPREFNAVDKSFSPGETQVVNANGETNVENYNKEFDNYSLIKSMYLNEFATDYAKLIEFIESSKDIVINESTLVDVEKVIFKNIKELNTHKGSINSIKFVVGIVSKLFGFSIYDAIESSQPMQYKVIGQFDPYIWNRFIKPIVHPIGWKDTYIQVKFDTENQNFAQISKQNTYGIKDEKYSYIRKFAQYYQNLKFLRNVPVEDFFNNVNNNFKENIYKSNIFYDNIDLIRRIVSNANFEIYKNYDYENESYNYTVSFANIDGISLLYKWEVLRDNQKIIESTNESNLFSFRLNDNNRHEIKITVFHDAWSFTWVPFVIGNNETNIKGNFTIYSNNLFQSKLNEFTNLTFADSPFKKRDAKFDKSEYLISSNYNPEQLGYTVSGSSEIIDANSSSAYPINDINLTKYSIGYNTFINFSNSSFNNFTEYKWEIYSDFSQNNLVFSQKSTKNNFTFLKPSSSFYYVKCTPKIINTEVNSMTIRI